MPLQTRPGLPFRPACQFAFGCSARDWRRRGPWAASEGTVSRSDWTRDGDASAPGDICCGQPTTSPLPLEIRPDTAWLNQQVQFPFLRTDNGVRFGTVRVSPRQA